MEGQTLTIAIITLIILIILNAFFAASEIALIGLNDNKVKKQAVTGNKKAIMLYKLISEPSRFLSTIQIGITLAGFLASAFAADFFASPLANTLHEWGVPIAISVLETMSVVIITIILSYFTLVFGELVPKQLALQKAEAISNFSVTPLTWLSKLTLPIVSLLTFSTNTIVRLFGVDPNAQNEEATEEEIRMMVNIGGELGTIQDSEKLMIHNIFEFNDKNVRDIITHRTDMSILSIDASLEETLELINEKRYTRFPVYKEDVDNIVGILHVKDLFQFVNIPRESFDLADVIREPYFILETLNIDVLLAHMQKNNIHIAIVLDEYGGTEGLVTIEDLIEEIVGDIFSESDEVGNEEMEIKEIEPNKYEVDGTLRLWELEDLFHKKFPTEDFETVSGFLIDKIGYIPTENEQSTIEYKNFTFEVIEVGDYRIKKVILTVHEDEEPQSNQNMEFNDR